MTDPRPRRSTLLVALAYLALTLVMTWPLAWGLGRDVPSDLGDPLFVAWVLGWDLRQISRALTGDVAALQGFWNANIFYPQTLTLAFSEHFVAQAVQILPVYLATKNLILCYNLLFLSTFVLSALGMFLLVRELTGNATAAFLAGLIYGFAPYRASQVAHLQVMSSQWMPFALFATHRYFTTGRPRALAGAAGALIAQILSCGYYALFFTPVYAAYVIVEVARRRAWRNRRMWTHLAGAATLTAAVTLPFLLPYREAQQQAGLFRPRDEVQHYAADVYSYLTSAQAMHVWGFLRAFPKAEGSLFPGAVPALLAAGAIAVGIRRAWRLSAAEPARSAGWRRVATVVVTAGVIAYAVSMTLMFAVGPIRTRIGSQLIRLTTIARGLPIAAGLCVALLVLSPRARARVKGFGTQPVAFYAVAAAMIVLLSLGPEMFTRGQNLGIGPYGFLYTYVPGFQGLRVPARFAMLVVLCLAVLAVVRR